MAFKLVTGDILKAFVVIVDIPSGVEGDDDAVEKLVADELTRTGELTQYGAEGGLRIDSVEDYVEKEIERTTVIELSKKTTVILHHDEPTTVKSHHDNLVKFCPRCGRSDIITLDHNVWPSYSKEDPDNKADLTEYQCKTDGASFWA